MTSNLIKQKPPSFTWEAFPFSDRSKLQDSAGSIKTNKLKVTAASVSNLSANELVRHGI